MTFLSDNDISAIWLTFQLASISTVILLLLCTPLAMWLARSNHRLKVVVESLASLPLVLPPTVLGFYLLILLGPHGPIGEFFILMGGEAPAFRFTGLVIASVLYSLPFVVQPLRDSFIRNGYHFTEAAATLGASPIRRFFTISLPMAQQGFITAAVLGFAHTLGEFGVVLMIGGNIPGETQVLSIAIYDHVESLEYAQAHWLSAGLLIISFILLFGVYSFNKRTQVHYT